MELVDQTMTGAPEEWEGLDCTAEQARRYLEATTPHQNDLPFRYAVVHHVRKGIDADWEPLGQDVVSSFMDVRQATVAEVQQTDGHIESSMSGRPIRANRSSITTAGQTSATPRKVNSSSATKPKAGQTSAPPRKVNSSSATKPSAVRAGETQSTAGDVDSAVRSTESIIEATDWVGGDEEQDSKDAELFEKALGREDPDNLEEVWESLASAQRLPADEYAQLWKNTTCEEIPRHGSKYERLGQFHRCLELQGEKLATLNRFTIVMLMCSLSAWRRENNADEKEAREKLRIKPNVHRRGKRYMIIAEDFGLGALLELGPSAFRWDRLKIKDYLFLREHITRQRPRFYRRWTGLNDRARQILMDGLKRCGWSSDLAEADYNDARARALAHRSSIASPVPQSRSRSSSPPSSLEAGNGSPQSLQAAQPPNSPDGGSTIGDGGWANGEGLSSPVLANTDPRNAIHEDTVGEEQSPELPPSSPSSNQTVTRISTPTPQHSTSVVRPMQIPPSVLGKRTVSASPRSPRTRTTIQAQGGYESSRTPILTTSQMVSTDAGQPGSALFRTNATSQDVLFSELSRRSEELQAVPTGQRSLTARSNSTAREAEEDMPSSVMGRDVGTEYVDWAYPNSC